MQKALALLLIFSITSIQLFAGVSPGTTSQEYPYDNQVFFSPDQLENLLAPIALYPDPLLAQVLLAATFPDQVDQAARTMRGYNNRYDIDSTEWDVSVKAVAHYPTVLSMMADKLDWTTSVGQAYVNQSSDVMEAIQRLRHQAHSYGNLITTPQQQIVETGGFIYIYPANPQYIYVPTYDPTVVYFGRPSFWIGPVIWFSAGFLIGAWLNHDCDWHHHRVFYHGWYGYGGYPAPVWAVRSRPFIHVSNVYVDRRFDNVIVNRNVIDHHVNYGALDRYRSIHRDTDFSNIRRRPGNVPLRQQPGVTEAQRDNKIIRRNIDPNDPRIHANRGYGPIPTTPPTARIEQPRPEIRTPQPPSQPRIHPQKPEIRPPHTPPTVITPPSQPQVRNRVPDIRQNTNPPQPQPNIKSFPSPQMQVPRAPNPVFHGNTGSIDARDASRRGQMSREHINVQSGQVKTVPQPGNLNRGQSGQGGRSHGRTR